MVECPFYNISSLNLSNNQIANLSPAIGLLVTLRRLDLGIHRTYTYTSTRPYHSHAQVSTNSGRCRPRFYI